MKFIVNSRVLGQGLQSVNSVISDNKSMPIIANVLFEIKGRELVLTGTDLETTIRTTITLDEASGDVRVAVPAKRITEIVSTFGDMPLLVEVNEENYWLAISSEQRMLGDMPGENPEAYPILAEEGADAATMSIDADILISAISKTAFATAIGDTFRPTMAGIYFDFRGDHVIFVGTDAQKLVRYSRMDVNPQNKVGFIVPRKSGMLVKSILGGKGNEAKRGADEQAEAEDKEGGNKVKLSYNDKNVFFTFDKFMIACRLIDGKYPNYDAVIPKENPNKLTIDKVALLNAVQRIALFGNDATPTIQMNLHETLLEIQTEDADTGRKAKENLPCHYEGEEMVIGFNAKSLLEMLKNVGSEEVSIEMSDPTRAGLIIPIGGDPKEEVLMLLMPFLIR
ncbi:MAG: DNA polymerase III subunit beta [Bacteroidales bacterium]|jgi:DNA polymerase-3 subunit beta|nr:DNA polymerase III subunit beta [Bacteroidales bacterium]